MFDLKNEGQCDEAQHTQWYLSMANIKTLNFFGASFYHYRDISVSIVSVRIFALVSPFQGY